MSYPIGVENVLWIEQTANMKIRCYNLATRSHVTAETAMSVTTRSVNVCHH